MAIVVNGKKVAGVGLPGKDGAPGADGKDGAPGKSAYQAAKEKGYTGTEEEFNTALAGMQSAPFLPLSGGTVEGVLEIRSGIEFGYGSNSIELSPSSASRLELGANASGGFSGGSIGGTVELIGVSAPTASNSAANKQYVDEHAGARVATGSYVGTGDYNSGTGWGSSNPTSLTFDFAPKLLIIGWQETLDSGFFTSNLGDTSNNYYSIYTGALTTQFKQYRGFGDPDSSYAKKSSDGKTITWYSTHHANSQRNDKRHKYYYLAIG